MERPIHDQDIRPRGLKVSDPVVKVARVVREVQAVLVG